MYSTANMQRSDDRHKTPRNYLSGSEKIKKRKLKEYKHNEVIMKTPKMDSFYKSVAQDSPTQILPQMAENELQICSTVCINNSIKFYTFNFNFFFAWFF